MAEAARELIERYRELQEVISLLGIEELSATDRQAVSRARRLVRYLTQPFSVTAQFTGMRGASVDLEVAIDDCAAILDGQADNLSESALYLVGTLDDARAKDKALSGGAK